MKYMRIVFIAIIVAVYSPVLRGADPQDMPTVKKQVNPVYPELLKKAGVQGQVWLRATIDESGKVVDVSTEKATNQDFVPAAVDAVKQWEFNPGMKDGKPIRVMVTIPFNFKLDDKSHKSENENLTNIENNIKALLKGNVSEALRNQIGKEAHIVIGNQYELLSSILFDPTKRKQIVEGNNATIGFSRMELNDQKNCAVLVLQMKKPNGKKSRFHTIVIMKSSEGEWKIETWHMSA